MDTRELSERDPRISEALDLLERVGGNLTLVRGQAFTDEEIFLDGRRFENCTFTRCRVHIDVGAAALTHNSFSECQFLWGGTASGIAAFIREGFPMPGAGGAPSQGVVHD